MTEAHALHTVLRLTSEWSSTQLRRQRNHLLATEPAHSSTRRPTRFVLGRGRRARRGRGLDARQLPAYPSLCQSSCTIVAEVHVLHSELRVRGEGSSTQIGRQQKSPSRTKAHAQKCRKPTRFVKGRGLTHEHFNATRSPSITARTSSGRTGTRWSAIRSPQNVIQNCGPELWPRNVAGHVVDPARESTRPARSPAVAAGTNSRPRGFRGRPRRQPGPRVRNPARESPGLHASRRSPQAPAQAAQALGGRRSDRAAVGKVCEPLKPIGSPHQDPEQALQGTAGRTRHRVVNQSVKRCTPIRPQRRSRV
jgi:hypothetical protein